MICQSCGNRIIVATESATCLVCQHTGRQVADETPDETNDRLRAQVEREMPTPRYGFETEEMAERHRGRHEARFNELVQLSAWLDQLTTEEMAEELTRLLEATVKALDFTYEALGRK